MKLQRPDLQLKDIPSVKLSHFRKPMKIHQKESVVMQKARRSQICVKGISKYYDHLKCYRDTMSKVTCHCSAKYLKYVSLHATGILTYFPILTTQMRMPKSLALILSLSHTLKLLVYMISEISVKTTRMCGFTRTFAGRIYFIACLRTYYTKS